MTVFSRTEWEFASFTGLGSLLQPYWIENRISWWRQDLSHLWCTRLKCLEMGCTRWLLKLRVRFVLIRYALKSYIFKLSKEVILAINYYDVAKNNLTHFRQYSSLFQCSWYFAAYGEWVRGTLARNEFFNPFRKSILVL